MEPAPIVRSEALKLGSISDDVAGMQAALAVEENDGQLAMRVERLSAGPEIVPGLRLARVLAADGVTLRPGDRIVDVARGGFLDLVLFVPDR